MKWVNCLARSGLIVWLIFLSVVSESAQTVKDDWKLERNLYIILDASGSMFGTLAQSNCQGDELKINVAKQSLQTFLGALPIEHHLGLYVFDSKGAREIYPLGKVDRQKLLSKITNIQAGGKTPLGKAIDAARKALLKQKKKQLGYGDYTILIVTDGEANDKAALPRYVQRTTDEGIVIQVIGFCLSNTHSLKTMVHKYREADSPEELTTALESVLGEATEFTDVSTFEQITY